MPHERQPSGPTPAPRIHGQRASFGGIQVRHSPSSSNHSTPMGSRGNTSERRNKIGDVSPLVRSREPTPQHSRQSSGNLGVSRLQPHSLEFNKPKRITDYPSESSDEDPIPDFPVEPCPIESDSDSDNGDYSKPEFEACIV